jgi:hypothetical protein
MATNSGHDAQAHYSKLAQEYHKKYLLDKKAITMIHALIARCKGSWNIFDNGTIPPDLDLSHIGKPYTFFTDLEKLKAANLYTGQISRTVTMVGDTGPTGGGGSSNTGNMDIPPSATRSQDKVVLPSTQFQNPKYWNYGVKPYAYWYLPAPSNLFLGKKIIVFFKDKLEAALKNAKKASEDDYANWKKYLALAKNPNGGPVVTDTPNNPAGTITKGDLDAQDVVVNVSAVKSAYFRPNNIIEGTDGAQTETRTRYNGSTLETITRAANSNSPSQIHDAMELWTSAVGSKGMIQTYFPPDGWYTQAGTSAFPAKMDLNKYGFQFMYNPNSIGLSYQTTTQVDPAYEMAAKDHFNYMPSAGQGGQVTFSLLVNRMFDMEYYDSEGRLTTPGVYSNRDPYGEEGINAGLFNEQKMIYEAGTMYDIEFLLRTLMGYTMQTQLRQQIIAKTADMGIYNLRPVELHLGPALRYRGRVVSMGINHVLFNERMVPIMSNISITFMRYPDYPLTSGNI